MRTSELAPSSLEEALAHLAGLHERQDNVPEEVAKLKADKARRNGFLVLVLARAPVSSNVTELGDAQLLVLLARPHASQAPINLTTRLHLLGLFDCTDRS